MTEAIFQGRFMCPVGPFPAAHCRDNKPFSIPTHLDFTQTGPSYSGNITPETPGDSKNTFLHCLSVLGFQQMQHLRLWLTIALGAMATPSS